MQIGRIRLLYKFGCATGSKVFDQLILLSLQLFVITKSSNKAILRSPADWPRWFINICDQANYEYVWEYINPDATATVTATGSSGTAETATEDIGTTITPGTFPSKPSITDKASDSSFKMQLENYRRWEKKIKAIKSFDSFVM